MIRAVIQDGQICAIDPLPADWRDGRELIVEEAEPTSTDELEEWYRELQRLGPGQYEPGEREQVQSMLGEVDEEAKARVERSRFVPGRHDARGSCGFHGGNSAHR
jgi:hypothetical protein